MTQYADVTRSTGWIDVPVYNNSATAISAGYGVLRDTDVAGIGCACVKLPTGSGGVAGTYGVTTTAIPAYGTGMVCIHGPALMYGHSTTIVRGDFVEIYDGSSHLGEALELATTSAHEGLGWAMQDSAADGDVFEVFVQKFQFSKSA